MDEGEIFNMYHEVPTVAEKASWALKYTKEINDPGFTTGTVDTDKTLAIPWLFVFKTYLLGAFQRTSER